MLSTKVRIDLMRERMDAWSSQTGTLGGWEELHGIADSLRANLFQTTLVEVPHEQYIQY